MGGMELFSVKHKWMQELIGAILACAICSISIILAIIFLIIFSFWVYRD
jgi:hypothetical protein